MLIYFEIVEKTGWLSLGNVLAIITAVGVLVAGLAAWFQLRTMSRQMLATTLLALDERWESDAFKPARDELQKLTKRINDEIQKANPRVPPEDWMDMAARMYPERLSQLEGASPETYGQLLRVCGFFETVGLAARRKYIALEDIVELLGGSIQTASEVFENHIRELQKPKGSERLFEYCLWLFDQTWRLLERQGVVRTNHKTRNTGLLESSQPTGKLNQPN